MKKYTCSICGYVYDEALGDPENGIDAGTKWEDLPKDWVCPLCGAEKDDFEGESDTAENTSNTTEEVTTSTQETGVLSVRELSALFSNLAKGCEKQYRTEETDLFNQLATYFESKDSLHDNAQLDDIKSMINENLQSGYTQAKSVVESVSDRGALRALVWGEKVTKILKSLIGKYEKQHDKLLENTSIHVCEICGFVYIGDVKPEVCPVCKVPNNKIIEVKGGN